MNTFTVEHTPAEIVKVFPKASDLFKERRIDFCCGGDRPLGTVFTEKNIDKATVLSELNTAFENWSKEDEEVIDWDQVPLSELVDHIIYKHHAFLNEELTPLGKFVTKVFRVHGKAHPHLKELHSLYNEFKVDMEEHMIKEENEVFPLIKEYEKKVLAERIHEENGGLEDEHESQGNILKRIREITNDFKPHAEACNSYRITYARLAELESDSFQHIHLENNVLFKRIK